MNNSVDVVEKLLLGECDELCKRVNRTTRDIFCRGILQAETDQLLLGSAMVVLMTPLMLIPIVISKTIHITIVGMICFFFWQEITRHEALAYWVIGLIAAVLFYRDIYKEVQRLLLQLGNLFSGGGPARRGRKTLPGSAPRALSSRGWR